jgi:hypothetical protein
MMVRSSVKIIASVLVRSSNHFSMMSSNETGLSLDTRTGAIFYLSTAPTSKCRCRALLSQNINVNENYIAI